MGQASVTNLRPDDTDENPFIYMLKVQCIPCREVHDKMVGVNRTVRCMFSCGLVLRRLIFCSAGEG